MPAPEPSLTNLRNSAALPVALAGEKPVLTSIDLSIANQELATRNIGDPAECQQYVDKVLGQKRANIAYGGYLEKRALYRQKANFETSGTPERDIHLGIDFWLKAGMPVRAALPGVVHSLADNKTAGDYGPALILEHKTEQITFYTLYGHLGRNVLENVKVGQRVIQAEQIAEIGDATVNGGYAPHLHFQLILDLEGNQGDYPGVCRTDDLEFYQKNCPNPLFLLNI